MDANDLGEIPLNLTKKPIHGKGKELHNSKKKGVTPSSANVAPQMSYSGKRTHSLDIDGVDDNDDRNFKHILRKEPVIADGPPIERDLLPGNQILNAIEAVYDRDLGHQRSCYGDSGDLSAGYIGLKNLIEEKSKQIEAANEDLYQLGINMVDLKKEIEASTLEKDISLLQQAELMSKEEENRFQQMKMDLESKKQELGIFKIIFGCWHSIHA
ncbi:hypothetical protein LIER_15522 [Lithospermum erythrorhizon]|uniref:Uncharacterized protein n=1 Tax=Lithospermum erythrorhizon TaxID=34254 RepID=A0AAV3Q8I1_LITER